MCLSAQADKGCGNCSNPGKRTLHCFSRITPQILRSDPEKGAENVAAIDKWGAEGKLIPYVSETLPLSRAIEGLKMFRDRKAIGKIVITMDG